LLQAQPLSLARSAAECQERPPRNRLSRQFSGSGFRESDRLRHDRTADTGRWEVAGRKLRQEGSKLGAVAPHHAPDGPERGAARRSPWQGRGSAVSRCIPLRHGLSLPWTHNQGPPCPWTLATRTPVGCAPGPCRSGLAFMGAIAALTRPLATVAVIPRNPQRQAFAPDTTSRNPARFLRPVPTVRRSDARQRPVPLHRQSESLALRHLPGGQGLHPLPAPSPP
jgi:hypothetical protein